jgi:acetyltransferase-like isoleucine patch superfamily enzyme
MVCLNQGLNMVARIKLEKTTVNSDQAILIEWCHQEYAEINAGQAICLVETSKAVIEVYSYDSGILVHHAAMGSTVFTGDLLASIAKDVDEANEIKMSLSINSEKLDSQKSNLNDLIKKTSIVFTDKALELIEKNKIEKEYFEGLELVIAKDVMEKIETKAKPEFTENSIFAQCKRVLIITAGIGSMQVVDILLNDPFIRVIGFVDDNVALRNKIIFGIPVIGSCNDIFTLYKDGKFDSAIVGFTANISIRKKLYEECIAIGINMINAIDPTARINRGCDFGGGNIICSHVHIGIETVLGDNNFISANSSIDHHNHWGSHIMTGPNCVTSGLVVIENQVRFGTGVFVEPRLKIGAGSIISSGVILTSSVPKEHIVKTQLTQHVKPLI